MNKGCLNCKHVGVADSNQPCDACLQSDGFPGWELNLEQDNQQQENIFDLVYSLFAIKNNLKRDYTTYTIGQKTDMLQEIANVLNGQWEAVAEDDSQDKKVIVADMKSQTVEVWDTDLTYVDNTVLFSPAAAEKAKSIIPYNFMRSFC